jgi:hypothetical protein
MIMKIISSAISTLKNAQTSIPLSKRERLLLGFQVTAFMGSP